MELIDRQAAIEAIESITRTDNWKAAAIMVIYDVPSVQPERQCNTCSYNCLSWDEEPCDSCTIANSHYKPSAQPERKKGKWILNRDDTLFWNCSCCGELSDYKYRFCPDCGADMRGDTE